MSFINKNLTKICEKCGKLSSTAYYIFVSEVEYFIKMDSQRIINHDFIQKKVSFNDGTNLQYDIFMNSNRDIAVKLKNLITTHIICSDECENKVIQPPVNMPEAMNQIIDVFYCNNSMFNVSWRVILSSSIEYNKEECQVCGKYYPNINKTYIISQIINSSSKYSNYNNCPFHSFPDNYLVLTNINSKNPNGEAFGYNIDYNNAKQGSFCSNECCATFSKKTNSIIIFPNVLLHGNVTAISPDITKINNGFNRYEFNPSILSPL